MTVNHDQSTVYVPSKKRFWISVCIQLLIICSLALLFYSVVWTGKSVWIKTVPLDPYDPYFGNYYQLGYEIESIPIEKYKGKLDLKAFQYNSGTKLSVILAPSEHPKVYNVKSVYAASEEKPDLQANEVMIDGVLSYMTTDMINVDYHLNQYFISQELASKRADASGKAWIELRVSPLGKIMHDISFVEPKK